MLIHMKIFLNDKYLIWVNVYIPIYPILCGVSYQNIIYSIYFPQI